MQCDLASASSSDVAERESASARARSARPASQLSNGLTPMAVSLTWIDLPDQALLKLSGLPAFHADTIQAALPQDGARIRLAVGDTCYLDGALFEPADPDRSQDLSGMLTRTGEWIGLTWSVRKRAARKWPHPQLLLSGGAALNSALLPPPAAPAAAAAASAAAAAAAAASAVVESPQRGVLSSLDSQMGSLAALLADCKTPAALLSQEDSDEDDSSAAHSGSVAAESHGDDDGGSSGGSITGGSELVEGLHDSDRDHRLETMGSIAAMLEIMPHIDIHATAAASSSFSFASSMVHDGTVEALVGLVRGDAGGAVLEVTSACQVRKKLPPPSSSSSPPPPPVLSVPYEWNTDGLPRQAHAGQSNARKPQTQHGRFVPHRSSPRWRC